MSRTACSSRRARVAAGRVSRVYLTVQRARMRRGYGDDGFTLTEAIVSFTIFAIVSAAAVLALVTGVRTNNDTRDRVTAAQLAQQVTDRARAIPKTQLTATPTETTTRTVGNKKYSVTRVVAFPDSRCLAPSAIPSAGDEAVRKIAVSVVVTLPGTKGKVVRQDSVIAC